ncbi:MAG TPA: preprotein translocase subunit SecG [candidate division Zixibacteria bacterium]|nr:preprotein translocase subunit SecG [candidate division Zixibacteria bacterium]
MFIAWVVFHVIVCIALVLVVLMQASKGEGLAGSAFGGGGLSGAVFGGRGAATFLQKATTYLAVVFFVNCIALALLSSHRSGGAAQAESAESVVTQQAQAEREEAIARQQQQQQAAGDTTGGNPLMQVTPTGDTAGN